jgi:hypothetical protein
MIASELLTFDKALTKATSPTHVLLGNGFSVACRPDIFTYDQLLDRADLTKRPAARAAFDRLATTDFEIVMNALTRAADLAEVYGCKDAKLAAKFREDAEALKEVLVQAIAGSHPDRPASIKDEECAAAKTFLQNFDRKYLLNYDLLTYWALMRSDVEPQIEFDDGFRQPEDGPEEWVSWESNRHGQNLFYLHGGLHIYQSGHEIRKFTWSNTGIALMDQIREALDEHKFPLYVAEGTWQEKLERIRRSDFLGRARRSFQEIGGTLFVYGMSFSENDSHILDAIARSKVEQVFASIYGDPTSKQNKELKARAETLVAQREQRGGRKAKAIAVEFFEAESAEVWGSAP